MTPKKNAFVVGLAAVLVLGTTLAADWPLFRGNPLQTGVADTTLSQPLKLRWKIHLPGDVEGTAAVSGDTVYVGSYDEHLHALDLANGKEKWKFKAAGPIKAHPSVAGDRVYVGDSEGVFHCLDAATGQEKWKYQTKGEITAGANFTGGAVLFGSADETLYCLTKDGQEKWTFKIAGGPVLGTPAVVGDRTFVAGCDSTLHVLDTAKGTELGAVELEHPVGATVALDGTKLYVGTMTKQMLGIDWKEKKVLWEFESEQQKEFYASAALTDKLVVAASRDRRVYAIDRETGKKAWSFLTRGAVDSSPVVLKDRVYVASTDRNLYVLELATGKELEKHDLGAQVLASPAVAGMSLVIGTVKGDLFCFE